jgi:hypothetical protein
VANDPYTLRISIPSDQWKIQSVKLSEGADQQVKEAPDDTRLTILSSQSRDVDWEIRFRK